MLFLGLQIADANDATRFTHRVIDARSGAANDAVVSQEWNAHG
jgi:hypothetical protein